MFNLMKENIAFNLNLISELAPLHLGGECRRAGRDVQPALVIGRHRVTKRDSAPVQYNDIV